MNEKAEQLAEAHWKYVREVIESSSIIKEEFVSLIGFHYKSAMIHGYKHGRVDK